MGALNDCGGVGKSNYAKGEEFREFRGGMSTLWLSYLFTVGVVLLNTLAAGLIQAVRKKQLIRTCLCG